jgi:photosystem II stability/assembly factor-like uncharacterized protein
MYLLRSGLSLLALTFLLICGCSKDDKPADPPTPPVSDTLPTGWSLVKLKRNLLDVFFVDEKTGYVCGGNYVAKSTNGGVTWTELKFQTDSVSFHNMYFTDANTGWTIGNEITGFKNFLFRTTDGGTSWKKITPPTSFSDIQFFSKSEGYGIAGDQLYISSDSGNTWKPTSGRVEGGAVALFFLDAATGWVAGGSKISVTKDGGKSFTVQYSQYRGAASGMQFIDANHGWIPAQDGIYRTTNGGSTWELTSFHEGSVDVHFFNSNDGYALEDRTVRKSNTGGKSFTREFSISQGFIELHFTDPKHGWAVTYDGNIYRYVQP